MNIKKLDDKDVVFIDQQWTSEERELLSELLRKKKEKGVIPKRQRTSKIATANVSELR